LSWVDCVFLKNTNIKQTNQHANSEINNSRKREIKIFYQYFLVLIFFLSPYF